MKEFVSILISFIFMGIADSVDSFFGNAISIDAIVVCSSFYMIDLMIKSIGEIGTYTYRTIRKNEGQYIIVTGVVSFIIGIITVILKDKLVLFFNLTGLQKDMLINLIYIYPLYITFGRICNGLFEMTRLKNELKTYRNGLILFYFLLISLDALVFLTTKNVTLLYITTIISWIVTTLFLSKKGRIKYELPDKVAIKNVCKYGSVYTAERLTSRIFLMIYGSLASRLGTTKYAIHSVCYQVCVNLEIITNAYSAALMIKLPEARSKTAEYKRARKYKKRYLPIIVILNFVFAFIYLFILHGKLPITYVFPYFFFYIFTVFGLQEYETYKALLVVDGNPIVLFFGSLFGVLIRIVVCLIFINTGYGLYFFGITNFLDFYSRSIIFKMGIKKLNRKKTV